MLLDQFLTGLGRDYACCWEDGLTLCTWEVSCTSIVRLPRTLPEDPFVDNSAATGNAAFVVGSGALLGIGASFVWVAQGAIVTTYVPESQRGRAIAIFWIIFNLGGCIGSLASLASNYHSTSGSVSNFTNILLLSIMCAGWLMGISICPPSRIAHLQPTVQRKDDWRQMARLTVRIMSDWKVLCMLPLFFTANVFYPYQQNVVNGQTFTIRTRSLNGALYWSAQIFGGLFIGLILDLSGLNRQIRARIGWILLFVSGFIIWGGGYAFQKWSSENSTQLELKQYIDFSHGRRYVGPMFLYVFYGMYDAFWQSFCYWLIGTRSNSPKVTAILVGAYKMFQSIGGAMSWRLNAMCKPAMTQFAMNWGLCIGALVIVIPSVLAVTLTSKEDVYEAENMDEHEVSEKSSERGGS